MHNHQPSRTAQRVAVRRAAHQLLDHPAVFEDALALSIIGRAAAAQLTAEICRGEYRDSPSLRAFLAARGRFAEDELARAVDRGVRQYVVLGAGLDTFACRNPYADLRVFEVDHPSTQAWKRDQLAAAGMPLPANAVLVPVDFERQSLGEELRSAGFRMDESAFFSWLGVVPYLTQTAFALTIAYIAAMPAGSGVVFDYGAASSTLSPADRQIREIMAARVALAGEPFQLFFDPSELAARLHHLGFRHVEDLGTAGINANYFRDRADGLHLMGGGGHILSARI